VISDRSFSRLPAATVGLGDAAWDVETTRRAGFAKSPISVAPADRAGFRLEYVRIVA
jgi:hypothetical protein